MSGFIYKLNVLVTCVKTVSFWILLMILGWLPGIGTIVKRRFADKSKEMYGVGLESVITLKTFTTVVKKHLWEIIYREAEVGKAAINTTVCNVETKTFSKLLDFEKSHRPLIVNFGSCT